MLAGLLLNFCAVVAWIAVTTRAAPLERDIIPTVTLDNGTFVGLNQGTVFKYLGIPFAQPP
jgi:acetylcholinesterase